MSENPVFSFYLPAYKKSPETFEKCIESLLDQSYKDIEIVESKIPYRL